MDISNHEVRTPSFHCRKRESQVGGETIEVERKVETARPSLGKIENQDELFSGVLLTSHKLRRVVRKQSLEMKDCYSVSIEERNFRLPKILNKAGMRKT